MTFKLNAKPKIERSDLEFGSSDGSSDELIDFKNSVSSANAAAVHPSDFFELNDLNFVVIDPGTEERIARQNFSDVLQQGSGIIGASQDSLLGQLGFDAGMNGSDEEIRDFTSGFGLSATHDLIGLAARAGGQSTMGDRHEADWKSEGEPTRSHAGGNTTITRYKETNANDKEGNHTRTTVVVETSEKDSSGQTHKVVTTTTEEYDESASDSDGNRAYTSKQKKNVIFTHGEFEGSTTQEVYEEAGTIDKDGNRTPIHQSLEQGSMGGPKRGAENPKPLVPVGKINPNPEDDGAYGGANYEINHPALNRNKYDVLEHFDPTIDFGDENYASGPYTGPGIVALSDSLGGTSTGTWDPQGGPYSGPSLASFVNSMGGVSTGTDWL